MRFRSVLGLVVFLGVAGCGGGSGSSPIPTTSDFSFGELSGRAAVSNPPVSVSSQTIIGTAFTGTFSSLKIRELNPSLSETRIIASSDVVGNGLTSFAIDGTDPVLLTKASGLAVDAFPSAAANGKIVFGRNSTIEMINSDGSGLTQMVTGFQPSISNAGDKFSYIVGASLNVMNVSTKAVTPVALPVTFDNILCDVMSPDGNTVYYATLTGTTSQLYSAHADGSGTPTSLMLLGSATFSQIAVSPDNSELAIVESANAPAHIYRIGTVAGELAPAIPLTGAPSGLTYSADGQSILVSIANPGSPYGLYIDSLGDVTNTFARITSFTSTTQTPEWTPFIKDRTLISGGGGLLGTRACGVILGQMAFPGATTSVTAFDVVTPSSVVMTAQAAASLTVPNLVFSVDADSITKLAYTNTFNWRGIRAIGSGTPVTSANGALVSLDGFNGQVVSVLPFTGTRAAGSRPTVKDSGSIRTFSGSFLAVYDKSGKNIAPGGASKVELNTTNNTLTVTP